MPALSGVPMWGWSEENETSPASSRLVRLMVTFMVASMPASSLPLKSLPSWTVTTTEYLDLVS